MSYLINEEYEQKWAEPIFLDLEKSSVFDFSRKFSLMHG